MAVTEPFSFQNGNSAVFMRTPSKAWRLALRHTQQAIAVLISTVTTSSEITVDNKSTIQVLE
jgi:hypothetical protein